MKNIQYNSVGPLGKIAEIFQMTTFSNGFVEWNLWYFEDLNNQTLV